MLYYCYRQRPRLTIAYARVAFVPKVKIVHSPEPVPRGRASKLLPVPQDSNLSDDNNDEENDSWDEASANGHAWWDSGSEDEEYEIMSAMSPNLQAVLGLRRPSGIDPPNEEQGDNKNEWQPPSFAGLNNSTRVKVLRPLVVGHGKMLEVECRNRGRQEEEEGEDGDVDDDSPEGEGWDYQVMSKDDYDSYVREWNTNVSPNLARALGCPSSMEQKAKALSKQLSWEAPASFGLRNSGYIKGVGRTNSSVPTDDTTAEASRRPASSLKRSLVLRWRKAVDASCFGIGEHEQSA
ncbi:unnamed protein product [Ectocarpus sp. CCAP 1310/34]|nr:unnamed protein product [Ectocarpus sp. CCAP 1310/34]